MNNTVSTFPQSNWDLVNEIVKETDLHPFLVERALLWLNERPSFYGWYTEKEWNWNATLNEVGYVTLGMAIGFIKHEAKNTKEALELGLHRNHSHKLLELKTAHDRIKVIQSAQPGWHRKLPFEEYLLEFEEAIAGWDPIETF